MEDAFFLAGIELVHVTATINRVVDKMMCVTNDPGVILPEISPGLVQQAGQMEIKFLAQPTTLTAYFVAPIDVLLPQDVKQLHMLLLGWLGRVRRFLHCLWLINDNAGSTEMGWVEAPHKRVPAWIWRNFWQGVISKADGTREPTLFTPEEIDRACALYLKTMGRFESEISGGREPVSSRWNSSMIFVDAARIVENPGMKVAQYCTCLEALFGTGSDELTHKLAERVACFLEDDPRSRLATFEVVKKAYRIRSKVVHGSKTAIKDGLKAADSAIALDQLVRRILMRILDDPAHHRRFVEGNDSDLEPFFGRLLFGVAES
jgi:hypothetical protein